MYPDPTMFGFCDSFDSRCGSYANSSDSLRVNRDQDPPYTHLYAHRLRIDPVLISIVLSHFALCDRTTET